MIEVRGESLVFTFPEIHEKARLTVSLVRTLRIPDDGKDYPLPPGLGRFPLRHVDDFAPRLPSSWIEHGGVMIPMYQSEAMWIAFDSRELGEYGHGWPFAVKIATGKINAVNGKPWTNALSPTEQDYLVVPDQPWLDGYCVEEGVIRQFVAMPQGEGYSAEEQISGEAVFGGLQIAVFPMKREAVENHYPIDGAEPGRSGVASMDLAPGGRMKQEVFKDHYAFSDWQEKPAARCFVHIVNAMQWRAVTGEEPPTVPFTAGEYARHGLPWYEYLSEGPALSGSSTLNSLQSVSTLYQKKAGTPLHGNESVEPGPVKRLNRPVREGIF